MKARRIHSSHIGEEQKQSMPLTMVLPGDEVVLVSIQGGRGIKSRLHGMGLTPGTKLKVLNDGAPGPFLISVRDFKIAIGYGIAKKIFVK